jgi:hypothetical protein
MLGMARSFRDGGPAELIFFKHSGIMNALVGALNPRRLKRSPLKVSGARVVQGGLAKAEGPYVRSENAIGKWAALSLTLSYRPAPLTAGCRRG